MSYTHFTIEERCCLREFYKKGYSYRKIAKLLGRNVSSVSRELRRNCTHMYDIPIYYPHTAQKKSNLRRSYCHRGMFWSEDLIAYIEEKLLATWSPEQIANAPSPFEKMPSARTIYRWIYDKYLLNGNLKVLVEKVKVILERRLVVSLISVNPLENVTKVYTNARKPGIGRPIRWLADRVKAKPALQHWQNVKHVFILL